MAKNITKLKHRFPFKEIRKFPRIITKTWPIYVILVISISLAFLNLSQGTFLTGWDNLHPEFNISNNLKRAIFSVWQEYRSLGLLGGMAHSADIPRILLIHILSILRTPSELIRYITTFIPLVIGPLGVYFLFYHHIFRGKLDSKTSQFASFFGSLFYLLNLNTLQTFYVPFETFTWFYGALPWLIYSVISYLLSPTPFKASILFLIAVLSTPAFYVETMFIVFFVTIAPFFIEYLTHKRTSFSSIRNVISSGITLVVPNLFWLLPIVFFVFTNSSVAETTRINIISSPETYSRNLEFANPKDLSLLKGFLFNYLDLQANNKYGYLLSPWRNHLDNIVVGVIGFASFFLILIGLYYSIKKSFRWASAFSGVLFVCFFFLSGGSQFMDKYIPLIGQLFRSPFTKFSIPLSLCYSFFFAIGTIFLLDIFSYLHSRYTFYLTLFTITFALLLYMSPAFSGSLISPNVRRSIPSEYFELFDFFNSQDKSSRVASFPQNDFWGWIYYDWGYRGSGFLWEGIKQPLLDRAFDVWDKSSEKYYEEISSAIYSNNFILFDSLIEKYAIKYVLIDTHVIPADSRSDLHNKELRYWLDNSTKYSLVKNANNYLFVYQTKEVNSTYNPISTNEITNKFEPFGSTNLRPNQEYKIESDKILPPSVILQKTKDFEIKLPSPTTEEDYLPVMVSYKKNSGLLTFKIEPVIAQASINGKDISQKPTPTLVYTPLSNNNQDLVLQIDSQYYELQLPAEIDSFSYFPLVSLYLPTQKAFIVRLFDGSFSNEMDLTNALKSSTPYQCFTNKPNRKIEKIVTQDGVSLLGTDVVGCLSTQLPLLSGEGAISYSFTYSSPTTTPANASITNLNLGATDFTQPLIPQSSPKRTRLFSSVSSQPQKFNLILEANQTKSIQEIHYQDIRIFFHPLIFTTQASINPIPEATTLLTEENNTLAISLPLIDSPYDISQSKDANQLFPESRNCDQFNKGEFSKKIIDEGFLYESKNAITCDYLDLRQLPHSLNYLITFDYRHQTGLPMIVCLENHATNRCDVYERLQMTTEPQSLVQPINNNQEDPGFTLHLFNQSIGDQRSVSVIKSFNIHPIPLNYLKKIIVYDNINKVSQTPSPITTHPAEFVYTAIGNQESDTLINLYQSYSPYWIALQVPRSALDGNLLSYIVKLPILYLTNPKLTPYVTNASWHNSWLLPKGDYTLFIFYAPQYLQFFGFVVIVLFSIFLVIKIISKVTKTKRSFPFMKLFTIKKRSP